MRSTNYLKALVPICALLTPLSATSAESQSQSIGLATHIENQVSGEISGQQRAVAAGNNVYQLEIIRTNANSKAQLAFLDSTVLSVGPTSEVNLDRFVYDPTRGNGEVILQMGRGTFRFVTGSQAKRNYKVVTPVATIGVRGTIFHVKSDDMQTIFVLQDGGITLTFANGEERVIDKPGWGLSVSATGEITGPMPWPGSDEDPFGVGWQQFADIGNPVTTGAFFTPFVVSVTLNQIVNDIPPCLNPSCH